MVNHDEFRRQRRHTAAAGQRRGPRRGEMARPPAAPALALAALLAVAGGPALGARGEGISDLQAEGVQEFAQLSAGQVRRRRRHAPHTCQRAGRRP